MRAWLAAALAAALCGPPATARADAAKAKAANQRGYALHKQKKYKEAAVEYRAALAEDPSYLIAHYNLACVASLTHDMETALRELAWVADRSTWDAAARSAAAKARTDSDLAWIRDQDAQIMFLTGTDLADEGVLDLLGSPMPELVGKDGADGKLVKALAEAPGPHAEKCSSAAFHAPLDKSGSASLVVTLRDGVALFDSGGKLLARSAPLGCSGPGDHITVLNQAAGVQKPYEYSDRVLMNARLVIVEYWAGGKLDVSIFALKDKKDVVRVFDGVAATSAGDGAVKQTPVLGNLLYTAPGEKKPRVLRWDAAGLKYVDDR